MQTGSRLEEERKRLGFTQDQMAGLGGVAKRTYCNYEAGVSEPNSKLLASLFKFGVDIQYIVTGQRSTQALTEDEERLITLFRAAPLAVKAATMAGLAAGGASASVSNVNSGSGAQQINSGSGAQQNFVNSPVGNVTAGDLIIGHGNKKG